MKVKRVMLENFKRFDKIELNFVDRFNGHAESMILFQGGNGSGKSSILQAIAAMIGVATGSLPNLAALEWPGYNFPLASDAWDHPAVMELEVEFSKEERQATLAYWQRLSHYNPELMVSPADEEVVVLKRKGEKVVAEHAALLFQFQGRRYVQELMRYENVKDPFKSVGRCLWYHVLREPISIHQPLPTLSRGSDTFDAVNIFVEEDLFRRKLCDLYSYHVSLANSPGKRDLYTEVEQAFKRIFPQRRFEGIRIDDRPGRNMDTLFYFNDGKRSYEVSELSGGERAVLPLLIDFVNWRIHRSVVLIDEVELHLNPMQQQNFVFALSELGEDNQIFMTTHSEQVSNIVKKNQIHKLPRC